MIRNLKLVSNCYIGVIFLLVIFYNVYTFYFIIILFIKTKTTPCLFPLDILLNFLSKPSSLFSSFDKSLIIRNLARSSFNLFVNNNPFNLVILDRAVYNQFVYL